ncbi:hypothetical protein AVEN_45150-1 [Araneus ventricosus]|uniref:Uncharacterized protein n=1 Tax=Araneus ventricosus TaxID=182803 RepID=A0A4Y2GS66_ARAVE|nr:hypothetical protein AVEN_45150-1 [Araneus ventricosus]
MRGGAVAGSKVSTLKCMFETDSTEDSALFGAWCTLNLPSRIRRLERRLLSWKFGSRIPAQVLSPSADQGSKLQGQDRFSLSLSQALIQQIK